MTGRPHRYDTDVLAVSPPALADAFRRLSGRFAAAAPVGAGAEVPVRP